MLYGALACWLAACEAAPAPAPTSVPSAIASRECPKESILRYENFGAPFFDTNCTGCHSSELPAAARGNAPVGSNFDTVEGIRSALVRIYARSADANQTMPPAVVLTSAERRQLGGWRAGRPEGSVCGRLQGLK